MFGIHGEFGFGRVFEIFVLQPNCPHSRHASIRLATPRHKERSHQHKNLSLFTSWLLSSPVAQSKEISDASKGKRRFFFLSTLRSRGKVRVKLSGPRIIQFFS